MHSTTISTIEFKSPRYYEGHLRKQESLQLDSLHFLGELSIPPR